MGSIRLEGDLQELMKRLHKIENIDKKGINLSLAEGLRTSTGERFKEEKGPDGKSWQQSVRAKEQNGRTLTNSARLKNSIRSSASDLGFAVGTNTISARTHQFGEKGRVIRAQNKKALKFFAGGKWHVKKKVVVKIPARPFLGASEDDIKEINATIAGILEE